MTPKKSDKKEVQDLLETARTRFDLAVDAESDFRKDALDDLRFIAGDQWPDDVKRDRDADSRPCLTINRLPQFVNQITNDQRQNRPAIKVNPVDDNADVETAKILQGVIRHIEYNSNADVAYDTGFSSTARTGLGFMRVITEYCDPMSFDQDIKIKRVRNTFSVYLDPHSQEPDGSDANWGFVFEQMSKEDFQRLYPDAELSKMEDWSSIGDKIDGWAQGDTVRIAEYFYKEYKEVELALLSNKQVIDVSELPEMLPEGLEIVSTRKSTLPVVKWAKINGLEVLEETEWLGKWIPIIPILGDELDIDGKLIRSGITRYAKDPQRMFNYWASSETEMIALAPKAPFIGVEGQFEGHEEKWRTANRKNHAYLEFKPKSIGGQAVGAPQRNVYEPPVQAITNARMQSADDLKATTGIYDAALGARSNENSGIAIQRRASQAQTANFHYVDNLSRSMRHLGRILVDLIPKVYDAERAIVIIGEDDEKELIFINKMFERKGKDVMFNLGAGKYDVTVSNGPSYASKRQEAVESMLSLTQSYPKVAEVAGDLMVKNMDWPGASEIAERLKKTLAPGLVEDKDKQPLPPEAKQQMDQMSQLIEQLTAKLNEAHDKIETNSVELESKERIEFAKIQANLQIEFAKLHSAEAITGYQTEIDTIKHRLELLGINEPLETESEEHLQENQNPAGGNAMAESDQQQPTGGQSPGNFMEQ